jgi:uncharacterized membrane protein
MAEQTWTDVFDAAALERSIARVMALTPDTTARWGRMNAAAMFAHLNVAYEMVYDGTHPRPNAIMRWLLRTFLKNGVCGPAAYKRSTPTAPAFRITNDRDFFRERERLLAYVRRVQAEGRAGFEGRESLSFGPLTATEWQVLFGKHFDHHLAQFGV